MARHGITYEDVISAANFLKGEGKSITIENVRRVLGTGSAGTVNQHLRRWKEAQNANQKVASKENLPEGLIALVKGLWESVLAQSAEQFAPIETTYQKEITELKTELTKYRHNNQRWQTMFNKWQQEKTVMANEKLVLEQALEFSQKENQSFQNKQDGLLQQQQEKQERIDELHRLHQQTQTNLEHYREAAREQRLLDQQQFAREKQQLLFEAKEFQEQLVIQQFKHTELHQQYQLLNQSWNELEKQNRQAQQSVERLTDIVDKLSKESIEFEQQSKHWQDQFKNIEIKLDNNQSEIIVLHSENKNLSAQLSDVKQLLRESHDQNKLLASEKWHLVQEKARLEGEMKQLQKMLA